MPKESTNTCYTRQPNSYKVMKTTFKKQGNKVYKIKSDFYSLACFASPSAQAFPSRWTWLIEIRWNSPLFCHDWQPNRQILWQIGNQTVRFHNKHCAVHFFGRFNANGELNILQANYSLFPKTSKNHVTNSHCGV